MFMKYVTIIPARGGSKRFPGKNTFVLNGSPLICHSIEYSLRNTKITGTYVSTDAEDIKSISKEEWELRLIALIDGEQIDLLLNRKGKINCTSYPPYCMFLDTYNKLTKEQQLALMPFIQTPPRPLY